MKLKYVMDACGLRAVVPVNDACQVTAAYTSDLLSDVIAHCPEDSILITVQNHVNTIAVATLVGARAIAVVHNRPVPDDMKALAIREGIVLLSSPDDQFTLSCRVGDLLKNPGSESV